MVWSIPFIFKAGNKAKANEVNFNFTSIKQFVDNLEEGQANNEISIARLEANKANINGDYNQRFQVADASGSFDAINKRTLQQLTANTKEVISGFAVSKFSSTVISCTAGVCWDSTYEYVIKSDIGLQTDAQTLSNSTTYYIYVCEDAELSSCQLILDTNGTTPTIPVGYDYYRRIGSCTTDDSGNIKDVLGEGGIDIGNWQGNNSIQLGDLLIQWGSVYLYRNNTATVTFPRRYKDTNIGIAGADTFIQYAGDKRSSWAILNLTTSSMQITSRLGEGNDHATIWWITIGRAG